MKSKRVLEEENQEAHKLVEPLLIGVALGGLFGATTAALGLAAKSDGVNALPFVGFFWGGALLCLLGFWRARRTIQRWRDQERERLDLAEAEQIGKETR